MSTTSLLTQISRSDTFPIEKSISLPDNYGYLSFSISDWTEQMYRELAALNINVFIDVGGEEVKYTPVSLCYSFNMNSNSGTITLKDMPSYCTLKINPIFNPDALTAHNDLVDIGIIDGPKWTTETSTFAMNVNLVTD